MSKVSVIIPTYNCARYITGAINSVISQTYKNLEIIVIDDGSKDNTKETLEYYMKAGLINYIYQENKGPAGARNEGIRTATGEYIAFLDADDLWMKDKLQLQIDYIQRNPQYKVIFSDFMEMSDGKITFNSYLKEGGYKNVGEGYLYDNLIKESFISPITAIISRDIFVKVGLFDEELIIGEDRDMWLRVAEEFQIGFLNKVLSIRNRHSTNLTRKRELYMLMQVRMLEKHLKRRMDDKDKNPDCVREIKRELENRYLELGMYYTREFRKDVARKYFWGSLKYGFNLKSAALIGLNILPIAVLKLLRSLKKLVIR